MAADELSLLFRLRGDSSGLKTATAEARAAIGQIRQTFGPELAQTVSTTNKAFSEVGLGLNQLTQRIPVVGVAVSRLTDLLRNVGIEGKSTERAVSGIANSITNIAQASGKSIPQVAQFLQRFTQIAGVAERDTAAVEFFGASLATKLTPQLAEARVALSAVTAEGAAAGASIGALAIPIGIAVIAVAALVAGLTLAAREMFALSKRTAEFQGHMQDLSQQTGLTVETLSTLEVAITTTGGSLNTVTQAMVQFQRQMEEAQDPLSKAAGNFEQLGVTVEDTESTLRAALLALAAMPEGFQQTNAAAELFGSRGGKQVLALLKETNGDLDALQAKLRDTGTLITTDTARAADKFNDELALLDFQLRASSAALAKELIPALVEGIQAIGDMARSLRPVLDLLGSLAGTVGRATSHTLKGLSLVVATLTGDYKALAQAIKESNEQASIFRDINSQAIPSLKIPDLQPVALPRQDAAAAAREAAQLADAVVAAAKRAAAETNQALNQAFEQGRINRQQQALDTIAANARILDAEKKRVAAELQLEEDKFKQIQNRADLAASERQRLLDESTGKIRKLQQQELDAQSQFDTTAKELRAKAAKEQADSQRTQERNATEFLLSELDRRIDNIETSETAGLKVVERLERAKIEVRRRSLEEQKRIGFLTVEAQREIDNQIQLLSQESDRLRDEQRRRRISLAEQEVRELAAVELARADAINSAARIGDESRIATIRALAALRVKTEEQAEREILRIRLDALAREDELARARREAAEAEIEARINAVRDQRRELDAELQSAGSTEDKARIVTALQSNVDAEIALQQKAIKERARLDQELDNQLRINNAERTAIQSQGVRDIDEARQEDLRNEREYADELADIRQRTADIQRDTAQEIIRLMRLHFASRKDIIRAQRDLDLQDEEDRHQQAIDSIRTQQRENEEQIRVLEKRLEGLKVGTTEEIEEHNRLIESLERLRAKRAELDAQKEAEDQLSTTTTQGIGAGAALEIASPDAALQDVFDELGQSLTSLASKFAEAVGAGEEFAAMSGVIAQQIGGALAGAFDQFANALGQTVANWVLLGETGPAVMRKILAQALASLAAEATVQAIKQLALGFATLFFNPAESAAHFTAAALWGSIAGGAALAGRSVAGDLFKPKQDTSTSDKRETGQLDPLRLNRPQPPTVNVNVNLTGDDSKLASFISATVVQDINSAGPIRETIANDSVRV
jgi:hypothetical protein